MKQICALILCSVLALCLAGCGGEPADSLIPEAESSLPPTSAPLDSSVPQAQLAPPVTDNTADSGPESHFVAAIRERGTLFVAVVEENPPFTFFNDDLSRQGLDNAMANTIAEELGVELALFSGTPEEVAGAVRSGRVDVALGGFAAGDTLLKSALETACYAGGKQVFLCCVEDVRLYPTLSAFNTKDIACLEGLPAQKEILKQLLPDCAAVDVSDIERGLRKLRSGACVALMLDEFQGTAYALDTADLALATPKLETDILVAPKVMAVMDGNQDLAGFINESVIKKYTASGGLGRLMISATTKASNLGLLGK